VRVRQACAAFFGAGEKSLGAVPGALLGACGFEDAGLRRFVWLMFKTDAKAERGQEVVQAVEELL
jgi:hypothetical protein